MRKILGALEEGRLLLVEHRLYRGGCAPERLVFSEYEPLKQYLREKCHAGDSIHVFDITGSVEDGKQFVYGKCPDEKDETPAKGAY